MLLVLAGAFAGGLVSGLTGFGTGLTALPIWLLGLAPPLASPLVVICSLVSQFQTLPAIWHAIDRRRCLSGPLPTIWAGLRGWGKDERRAVFQAFSTAILSFALLAQAAAGLMSVELGRLVLVALPGTVIGSFIGRRLYTRLDTAKFEKAVLTLLFISGLMLLASGLVAKLG